MGGFLTGNANANSSTPTKPRAYINYLLFDEQFHSMGSYASQVGDNSIIKDHSADLANIQVPKNGYIYIYCSNESPVDVFFDNLQVVDTRGPLMEETHYYPFGLTMAGISSKAVGKLENRFKYNGKELQHNEFSDGGGLEEYDYGARFYDVQIGRWAHIDLMSEVSRRWTPYNYSYNNPLRFIDADGMLAYDWNKNNGTGGYVNDKGEDVSNEDAISELQGMGERVYEAEDDGPGPNGSSSSSPDSGLWDKLVNFFKTTFTWGTNTPKAQDQVEAKEDSQAFSKELGKDFERIDEANRLIYGWLPGVDAIYTGRDASEGNYISAGHGLIVSGGTKGLAQIGTKLEYVFGKATGELHNIQRSKDMLRQLQRVGIFDNAAGRSLLQNHLEEAYHTATGVLQPNGKYLRESLLMGPRGGLMVQSVWENNKLIKIYLFGGK